MKDMALPKKSEIATFGAVCVVYNDDRWLPYVLASIYPACSKIYFLVGDRPWNGNRSDNSATLTCIQQFEDPERKMECIQGNWQSETLQRNAGLEMVRAEGLDYCFIVDADEIYDTEKLLAMMRYATAHPDVDCWHMTCLTYWKSERFRIDPPERFKPPVFVRTDGPQFSHYRLVKASKPALIPDAVGVCHHMSYARSDDEIRRKIETFSHADELQPDWYERVWLAWNEHPNMLNIHPTHPSAYLRAIPQPVEELPPVLQELGHHKT